MDTNVEDPMGYNSAFMERIREMSEWNRLSLGQRIKKLRLEQHMRLKDLALASGLDAANLSRIENDRYPGVRLKTIAAIVKGLDIYFGTLLD